MFISYKDNLLLFAFHSIPSIPNQYVSHHYNQYHSQVLKLSKHTFNYYSLRMGSDDAENLFKSPIAQYIENQSRPKQINIPRRNIDLNFAVILMRSSYNVVDELDFVPMDLFQRLFFLFRQSEWESYKKYHPNVMQGNLADASYFDFISLCQYAVISDRIKEARTDFFEKIGAEGTIQRVTRDPKLVNNGDLPAIHSYLVGEKVFMYMQQVFNASMPSLLFEDNRQKDVTEYMNVARNVIDIFLINSFATDGGITTVEENNKSSSYLLKLILTAPINLWSSQVLRFRKDNPVNDFENKVLQVVAMKMGFKFKVISTIISNNIDVIHIIRLE